ncbi:hypothetical protein VTL71DRAFT_5816 [Oculimacula yallundae]|uniref:Uncharacterized protein n=1 Tax=Oculimacula yallundae TaxID=86028 RepID=A0ABR4BYJ9_9HELO
MPSLVLSARAISMPKLNKPVDILGMFAILCSIRLRISEDYHRLLCSEEDGSSPTFVPWQTFAADPQAKTTSTLVVDIMDTYGDMIVNGNPNCMALWHNLCIMLSADLRIFELGAGCAGADAAHNALEKIRMWTQTPAARRAIIHAGQTYRLMTDRRPSDGDPLHTSNGLFVAALVLGLYIFMVPSKEDDEDPESYEILDCVNWKLVGSKGLSPENGYVDDPAVNFIRKGGPISIGGVAHHSGYQSARRVLLDFAHLLDTASRWRIGHYTEVLRIMSDYMLSKETSHL